MPTQKRTKNHHIVPKVLQKQFAIEEKHIWFSERRDDGSFHPPELRNIKKTFRKKDYYTVLDGDERSDVVEREFYGEVDDYLGKVLPKVLDTFSRGGVPQFSGRPLDSLRQVVMQMAKRTPDFIKDHDDIELGRQFATGMLESPDALERQKFEGYLKEPNRLREFGRDARVRATIRNTERVEEALQTRTVHWAVIESNHSFILSSKIALWAGNGGANGLINPLLEIWMPISPKISLILFWDEKKNFPLKNVADRDFVRKLNSYAMSSSDQIASHSKQLLESLIAQKATI